jgi:Na+-translocating ferredoxin:NAD+ oxidoreductase RnfD subunit
MKSTSALFVVAVVLALIGLTADFISAPIYTDIFATIVVCDLLALSAFGLLLRTDSKRWKIPVVLISVLIIYSLVDVALRATLDLRVLDLVH